MTLSNYRTLLLLTASVTSASAQVTTTNPAKYAEVSSSISITSTAVGPVKYYALNLSVSYPIGLPAASYISAAQLNTDFQNAILAYPSPQDPQEAILSTALSSIMQKYPQLAGSTLTALTPGQSIGGISIPSGNSIIIEIFNSAPLNTGTSLSFGMRQKLLQK